MQDKKYDEAVKAIDAAVQAGQGPADYVSIDFRRDRPDAIPHFRVPAEFREVLDSLEVTHSGENVSARITISEKLIDQAMEQGLPMGMPMNGPPDVPPDFPTDGPPDFPVDGPPGD